MNISEPASISLIVLSAAAALYLLIVLFAFLRRTGQALTAALIGGYAALGGALGILEALWRGGRLPQLDSLALGDLQVYGALALAFLTLVTAYVFMRRVPLAWLITGALFALGEALLAGAETWFPHVLWSGGGLVVTNDRLGVLGAVVGWLVFMIGAAAAVVGAFRSSRQPLLRNRLSYWLPVFLLIAANDAMIVSGASIPGNPLRLLAAALMGYLALTHDLPDVRQIARRLLVYLITVALIMTLYVVGVSLAELVFRALPGFNPLVLGALIALLLAVLFTPLLGLVRRWVDAWLRVDRSDPGRTLQQYGERISNVLEMERLAGLALGVIREHLHVQRGLLFLVDRRGGAPGQEKLELRAVRSADEAPVASIELAPEDPVAAYFAGEARPLLQYDIDLLPAFRDVSPAVRAWFRRLDCEIYIPILSKRTWIGMLAFGAKPSGNRYSADDIVMLSALGSQTAAALENARLVEDLMRLNDDLKRARRELEDNNRALERLDRTKSDFISIASHELRTPLTVIKGYVEMLLENPAADPTLRQYVRGISDGAARLQEIMDSMFDIAQIDARALQLQFQLVDLGGLIRDVCEAQGKAAPGRSLALSLDLPALPSLKADAESLRKVFQHLLSNAIKFTPDGGQVTVTGHVVEAPGADLPQAAVEIVVSDTGVGVDPAYRDLIFTKFYQAGDLIRHSTSKSRFKGGGSGLGLAVSKGIVEAHNGRIWVESPGHDETRFPGSHFHVLIPFANLAGGDALKMCEPVRLSL